MLRLIAPNLTINKSPFDLEVVEHRKMTSSLRSLLLLLAASSTIISACAGRQGAQEGPTGGGELIIYSGRSESLVGPLVERFEAETGIDVSVRWGSTSELAATLLEEGGNSPADLYYAQDPGGLGAVITLLAPLPSDILELVDPGFRSPDGTWVGISGRARVVVYNTDRLTPEDLPEDIWGFTDPAWRGRIGWPPTNASFQTMVTAMRVMWGEDRTRAWLEGIQANEPRVYEKNTPTVAAVAAGEVDVGFVNHYYLYRFLEEEGESFPARNFFLPSGGPGSLVMVSGAGVLATAPHSENAFRFIRFLLSEESQRFFSSETFEYPLLRSVEASPGLVPLSELQAAEIGLADLADLEGTIRLLQVTGVLP